MSSLRIEVYDPPGIATFNKRIAGIKGVAQVSGTVYRRQTSRGSVVIPANYSRIGEIINVDTTNHANDIASLIRMWRDSTLIFEGLVNETPNVVSDSPTTVHLDGVEAVMDWAVVEPWDWDGSADFTSQFPDWVYGGRNVLVDPLFDNPTCSPRISEFWTDATSGTWTATVNGNTTAGIPFNATPLQVETAYEALASVTDVLVQGTGLNTDPWQVTFVDPCFPSTYSVSSGTLNGRGLVSTLISLGAIEPTGWTKSMTVGFGVPITFGNYTTFEVEAPPTPAPCGTDAIHIVGSVPSQFSFPGAQTVPSVTPGGLYQESVWVYHQEAGSEPFRVVIRPITEEPLIRSSTWPSISVPPNTWTELPIVDLMIPEGVDEVIYRVAFVGTGSIEFWIACPELNEGQAATTVGDIMGQLLDDAQTDHAPARETILFIDPTFTAILDTAGNAWADAEVSITIPRGMSYRKVLEALLLPLEYEWSVTPDLANPGVWFLNVWNPGARVVDVTAANTPSLLLGQGTLGGSATKSIPRANVVIAEGEGGYSSREEDTASFPVIGRREAYRYQPGYQGAMVDSYAVSVLARFGDESYAPRFDIADQGTHPIPMVNYGLAYRLNVDLADGSGKISRDVEAIGWRDTDEGLVWSVHTGMAQFSPVTYASAANSPRDTFSGGQETGQQMAPQQSGYAVAALGPTTEATRWLLDNFNRQRTIPIATTFAGGGGGGEMSVTVAAVNASELEKSKADFQCTGVGDANIIMAAYLATNSALTNGTSRVKLSSGSFAIDPDIIVFAEDVWLQGNGFLGTELFMTGDGRAVRMGSGADVMISDLVCVGNGTTNTAIHSDNNGETILRDIWFFGWDVAWQLDANFARASGLRTQSASVGYLVKSAGGYRALTLSDCYSGGQIDLPSFVGVSITNNMLAGPITGTDPRGWTIHGNVWEGAFTGANGLIELGGDPGSGDFHEGRCVVANNVVGDIGLPFVYADQVEGLVCVGNVDGGGGYLLNLCSHADIVGNIIRLPYEHGIALVDSDDCNIADNTIWHPGQNVVATYDGIIVTTSDRNYIHGNKIVSQSDWQAAHAVNIVSGTDNKYAANDASGTFATAAYADTGTATQNTWPAAGGAQGDNFV